MSLKQPIRFVLVAVALVGCGAFLVLSPPQPQRLKSGGGHGVKVRAAAPTTGTFLPIIMYHQTPIDFEQQLRIIQARGYTTVSLSSLTDTSGSNSLLPPKPVVLTFDDGFADQMIAFTLLEKYRMKATFYIVNGGPSSHWCIGASRRYYDPSQQIGGCGDAYLNWDQIRELDRSGLITIGGHTIDHVELARLKPEDQRHQIEDGKLGIEQELGHPISDFAYPYGSFDATSIAIVQQAGYNSAVTTLPGLFQDPTQPFTLRRIRDVQELP